jgi:hypothetical protein
MVGLVEEDSYGAKSAHDDEARQSPGKTPTTMGIAVGGVLQVQPCLVTTWSEFWGSQGGISRQHPKARGDFQPATAVWIVHMESEGISIW